MESGSWHDWHFAWRIGAMFLVKVIGPVVSADVRIVGNASAAVTTAAPNPRQRFATPIARSFEVCTARWFVAAQGHARTPAGQTVSGPPGSGGSTGYYRVAFAGQGTPCCFEVTGARPL